MWHQSNVPFTFMFLSPYFGALCAASNKNTIVQLGASRNLQVLMNYPNERISQQVSCARGLLWSLGPRALTLRRSAQRCMIRLSAPVTYLTAGCKCACVLFP
jgi:hypothetical protein